MNRVLIGMIAAYSLYGLSFLYADTPPRSAKPIAAVLELVTAGGYQSVTEISYDDGYWEVEALKGKAPVELHIDPKSGEIVRERADGPHPQLPAGAKTLGDIITALEKAGYGQIGKIELEHNGWEAEARRGVQWREILLDFDGKIISDHPED
jgi:hypothetical protein